MITQHRFLAIIANLLIGFEVNAQVIEGTNGPDVLVNPTPNTRSRIYGRAGNDHITGGRISDILNGQGGNDRVLGAGGDDLIYGGAGKDYLYGQWGDDKIYGGIGDDVLFGEWHNDFLQGGEGRDLLWGGEGDDEVDGGDHSDRIYGGLGNDILTGGSGNDQIYGQNGSDRLYSGEGADFLYGGSGSDVLYSGVGTENDLMTGGTENDLYFFGVNWGEDIITDFDPDEIMNLKSANVLNMDSLNISQNGFDTLIEYGGNTIRLVNYSLDNIGRRNFILAEQEGELILGNDQANGFGGGEIIVGFDGDDRFRGGKSIYGGSGNDNYFGSGIQFFFGGSGDDSLELNWVCYCEKPSLYGDDGNDVLKGHSGQDYLYGGQGSDRLNGRRHRDHLFGGEGNDSLSGELGRDTFYFGINSGHDQISDFTSDELIDLVEAKVYSISELHIFQDGLDTIIEWELNSIKLLHYDSTSLTSENFKFSQ